ncbi:DNA internalization-related competence protein ComEC/Rec2 [Lactobacillus iners]|uniref:DNA internalization-related competence protein ComEC/Rec2 n=1 Tax=Lactobacillus iners TaxID=147802 RepID=UPI003EC00775
MKSLNHISFYNLKNGQLLLLALILAIESIALFLATNIWQVLVSIFFIAYLLFVFYFKFKEAFLTILCILLVFFLWGSYRKNISEYKKIDSPIKVYPDKLSHSENLYFGCAKYKNSNLYISINSNQQFIEKFKKGIPFWIKVDDSKINSLMPNTVPGQFNFKKWGLCREIKQQIQIKHFTIVNRKPSIYDLFYWIRYKIKEYLSKMPRLLSFFSHELILAENPDKVNNKDILNSYRNLGVIHLLSISGLHVSLYTMIISKFCSIIKRTERECFILCTVILFVELFLSAFQPGFFRATLTFLLSSFFKSKKIPLSLLDILSLVFIFHLFLQPSLLLNVGAILSYLLVVAIIATKKYSMIMQNIFVNLAILPILLHYFFQMNILTIIFNFLIVPIFNFVLLPITFINLVMFAIIPKLSFLFEMMMQIITKVIETVARAKIGIIIFGQINWWQTILLLILTFILIIKPKMILFKLRIYYWLSLGYLLFFILIHFPLYSQVAFIDVGQGDSILITTPLNRKCYLIDVGGKVNFGKKGNSGISQTEKILLPFLYSQGINKIDGIFLSHQDADHVGNLRDLLSYIRVKKIYFGDGLLDNNSFKRRIAGKVAHTKLINLLAGNLVQEANIKFHILYPFEKSVGKNEDSLSLMFNLSGDNWIFTGDLDRAGEVKIINNFNIKADYIKLGHHGSRTATDPKYLRQIRPKLAIISSGRNNRFGHPHAETLKTLNECKIPYLNTQDNGTIIFRHYLWNKKTIKTCFNKDRL